jgi:hypothetical protein
MSAFLYGAVLFEREVRSRLDMRDIEEEIVRQSGGESHRCNFFESADWVRLRVAALYRSADECMTVSNGHLSVSLKGKVVTIKPLAGAYYGTLKNALDEALIEKQMKESMEKERKQGKRANREGEEVRHTAWIRA